MKKFALLLSILLFALGNKSFVFAKTTKQDIKIIINGKKVNYSNFNNFVWNDVICTPVKNVDYIQEKYAIGDINSDELYIGLKSTMQPIVKLNTDHSKQLLIGELYYKDVTNKIWYIQQVTNNSSEVLEINVYVVSKDLNENTLETKTNGTHIVRAEEEIILAYLFNNDDVKTFDYIVAAKRCDNPYKTTVRVKSTDIEKYGEEFAVTCTDFGKSKFVEITDILFKTNFKRDSLR